MENEEEKLNQIVNELRREKARIWRNNNKDKVREINKRYWLNKTKKELAKRENQNKEDD